jgi:2Fe-2S ferredoxin
MLEVAHANKIDIEGACGGETACSTCHIYVDESFFKKLPEMEEAEEDMLDLASGLKDNSRLGCQVYAAANLDGLIVTMPKEVTNMQK